MTSQQYSIGATRAKPPGPKPTTHVTATAARADKIEAAWRTIRSGAATDNDVADACRMMIEHCRDGRRDTARDILQLIRGSS